MKKLFSLLLALTMVLSLVVVPARADNEVTLDASQTSIEINTSTDVTANVPAGKTMATGYPKWSATTGTTVTPDSSNVNKASVTSTVAGQATITYTYKYSDVDASEQNKTVTITFTDNAGNLRNAITSVKYNNREYYNSTSKSVTAYKFSDDNDTNPWSVTATGYTVSNATYNSTNLTITATKDSSEGGAGSAGSITTTIPCTLTPVTVTVTAKPAKVATNQGTATLTATATAVPNAVITYVWKNGGTTLDGNTATILLVKPSAQASITCIATYTFTDKSTKTATTASAITVDVDNTTYEWTGLPIGTLNMAKGDTNTTTLPAIKLVTSGTANEPNDVAYSYVSSNPSAVTVIDNSDGSKAIKAVGSGYATITITAKDKTATDTNYRGLAIPYTTAVTVSSTALEYSLGSVTNGSGAHSYSYDSLRGYAASVINTRLGNSSNLNYSDVTSLTVKSGSLATLGGSFAPAVGPLTSAGLTYTAPNASIGKASITLTATTTRGNFDIAYNISVTPISWTFESVTAEPVVSNSAYYNNTYKVTFPTTTFNQFYVVNKTGVAPADYSSYNLITGTTSTTLNATDFNSSTGTCTLFVIAWNSNYSYNWSTGYSGKYYCGPITVTQTNHDIKYNGVVGGTVQFKHNDFTTFMNEMYGTNTTSYLTFNSVKFTSVPNATTQGTLYYNGVAMTTGYGSNYFNTSTAVTNLDNVSFSVSSRVPSTTKEIRIPFTLYATRYNSYGTSAGTSVTYSGVVVISLVREDVTFTVAPGDSVRFTDSAFLTYLRSASGINYNYNIDYVTFDQSAVNALNEGVLYAYSTGFNAVKTTDRFYYTTTSYNQNALSDVTFRASTYAKTGTTVYIPFTIYAKYGTSSATRQVTGTVAIKIAQTMNFVDVKTSDYFYDSVKWAVNNNITKGTSATTFSPNNTCTRAEIVTFLWRAAGSPTPTITRNPFTDVKYPVGSDFYNAILWASQNGIAAGTSTTTFAPNDNCTRAQIVTFLWRYAKKPLGYYTNPFNDVNKTEYAAYYDAILWAAGKGIATGNTPKTFDPDGTCTRAEAVTFLYRYESTK